MSIMGRSLVQDAERSCGCISGVSVGMMWGMFVLLILSSESESSKQTGDSVLFDDSSSISFRFYITLTLTRATWASVKERIRNRVPNSAARLCPRCSRYLLIEVCVRRLFIRKEPYWQAKQCVL